MTLRRHGYDSLVNAIRPNADQLIGKTRPFSDSWAPAREPSGADCGDEWQICHGDFRPAHRMCPEGVDGLRKEAPAFSRRVSAEVAARDQRLVPPAELAMRGIKHDNLPQGSSKELWMIGNIAPAWQRREPTLKFGCKSYKAYKTFSAAISTRPATVWIVRRSRCTPGSLPYPRFNCMRIFSYTVSWFLRAAEGRATRIEEPSR